MARLLILIAFVLYAVAAVCALTDVYSLTALETLGLVAFGLALEAVSRLDF